MLRLLPKPPAIALIAFWGVAVELLAASPSLTRLVPADAGMCVMAEGAAGHVDRFLTGPLYARWQQFPPLAAWDRENRPALDRIRNELGQQLGLEVRDVWRRILGRQTVLAVWPPEPGEKQGPGLLLVEAEDAAVLSKLVAGIRALQARSGELDDARFINYRGLQYEERQVRRDGETVRVYLATLDRVGLLSSHASLIERAIDLQLGPRDRSGLAELPAFQAALDQLDPSAPLKLFVNPRAWDALLTRALPASEAPGRGQKLFLEAWRSARFAGFCLRLEPAARLEAMFAWDEATDAKQLPELLGALSGTTSLLERLPADALAAAAINFDAARLLRSIGGVPGDASRKRSGPEVIWNLVDATFQGLGPQFAASVSAAPPDREFPLDTIAALGIHSRLAADDQAGSQRSIESLRSLLQAAAALAGPQDMPPQVKSQMIGKLEILTVGGLKAPPGLEPSFAFQGRTMLVGSSPRGIGRVGSVVATESLGARLAALLPSRLSAPSHVLYLNLARLRQFLAADSEKLIGILTKDKPESADETRRGLEELSRILNLGDTAILAAQVQTRSIRLVAGIAIDQ